ncbi:MAG: hypothetical protein PUK59_04095 [Actinomycetaceae bacterium]|nr:hypothetical protein [Actinomycetaceae bacterium]MDY5854489.1 hypothetical protein [Arcanobacterium sp.]
MRRQRREKDVKKKYASYARAGFAPQQARALEGRRLRLGEL